MEHCPINIRIPRYPIHLRCHYHHVDEGMGLAAAVRSGDPLPCGIHAHHEPIIVHGLQEGAERIMHT